MDRFDLNAQLRRRGSNQKAIARKLGVTRQCVNNVTCGIRHNAEVERELARVLAWPLTKVRAALAEHTDERSAA